MANELGIPKTNPTPMATVATASDIPEAPAKEAARIKKSYMPRKWEHHREDDDGNPRPPGSTWVYFEKGDPTSGVLCKTEEEYVDALNRGARDSFAPEAWE